MRNNNTTEPTPAEFNEYIEAYQDVTPEAEAEARAFILAAFDDSLSEYMNDSFKAEAHDLAKEYFGHDCGDDSLMFSLMTGFLMGMLVGMRVPEILNVAE